MKTLIAAFLIVTAASLVAQSEPALDIVDPVEMVPGDGGPLTPDVTLTPEPSGPMIPDSALPTTISEDPRMPSAEPFGTPASALEGLKDLTPEERGRYALLLTEASKLIQGIRILEALERILEAEAIYADYFALQNLKGAAYTKVRNFDKATEAFKRCLELNPDSIEAKFNLSEMSFVMKDYDSSLEQFRKVLEENPRLPAQTRNLLLYKIYLCELLLDRSAEADKLLTSFSYMSDTPEYYFANAAKLFHADKKEEAREWLHSAQRIYEKPLQDLFVDSLVEIGWIETL